MGFIPLALVAGVADDIEKVSLGEGQFLRNEGAMGVEGTDDFLGREDGGRRLGYWGQGSRDLELGGVFGPVEGFPEGLHGGRRRARVSHVRPRQQLWGPFLCHRDAAPAACRAAADTPPPVGHVRRASGGASDVRDFRNGTLDGGHLLI